MSLLQWLRKSSMLFDPFGASGSQDLSQDPWIISHEGRNGAVARRSVEKSSDSVLSFAVTLTHLALVTISFAPLGSIHHAVWGHSG